MEEQTEHLKNIEEWSLNDFLITKNNLFLDNIYIEYFLCVFLLYYLLRGKRQEQRIESAHVFSSGKNKTEVPYFIVILFGSLIYPKNIFKDIFHVCKFSNNF